MGKKLYVGNLSYDVDSSTLQQCFAEFGEIVSAEVISDRDSGRSKGFGFVEMATDDQAAAAIAAMNGKEVGGRSLTVNEAKPREPRSGGFGGGGGSRWRQRRRSRGGFGGGGGGGGRGGSPVVAAVAATAGNSLNDRASHVPPRAVARRLFPPLAEETSLICRQKRPRLHRPISSNELASLSRPSRGLPSW